MSSSDYPSSDGKPSKHHDDAKSPFHDSSPWPSWITHSQNSLASNGPEIPVDSKATIVSSLANDAPTSLSASNYPTPPDDNLSVGSLVLSDSCGAPNSDDCKQEEKVQAYSLIDSVNTSDDIKSSGSTITSRGGSVHRTSGAVSKKHQSVSTGKGSWSSAVEKGLKIIAKSSSCHKETAVADDVISPSSSAPPPPPPTPNVLTSDTSHEHSFLAGVSSGQVPFSTSRRSGSLASWPPPSQLPSSGKRAPATCATNSTSSHHKEAARSSHLLHLFNSAKLDPEDCSEADYLVLDSPTHHSAYSGSTNHSLYDDSCEIDSTSVCTTVSKAKPLERSSTLNSRSINTSPSSTLVTAHGPDVGGVCNLAEGIVSSLGLVDVGACFMGHSSNSSLSSSGVSPSSEACSTQGLPSSSMSCTTGSSMVHLTISGGGSSSSSQNASLGSAGSCSSVVTACSSACSCGRLPAVRVCSSSVQGVSSSGSIRASSSDRQSNAPPSASAEAEPALHQRQPVHNAKAGPMYNWQATLTTVKERFAFLFNNEILSDVQFVVGRGEDEQNIPAHKFVLAVGSAVFDAMFNGQLASQQQLIRLPDVEPQAFLALLSFLYSDEVQIGPETVMTVLYTAKKYAVPALERRCVDFLKTNLSSDNAFMLLTQARLFDEPQLAALCLKTIDKCTAEAIVAEGFTDIDHDTLSLVLQRDTLRIKELHLFQAVCRWAEAECVRQGCGLGGRQQRAVLSQALKLIRFPLMTVEEFAQGPAQSNILTDAEVVQLFLYFSVNPKPSVDFIDVPRCCMTGKEQTMCRFQSTEARWGYSGTPDRIRFHVDRRIFVVGFGMYGSIHGPSEYEVTVQLIHTVTGKVCGSYETVFTSDGTCNTFRVMFPDPIEVLPNSNYTAYATLKGPDSHYGTKGLRKVVVECPSGDRVCFAFSYAAGNNNGTSVEDGQIPEIIFYT